MQIGTQRLDESVVARLTRRTDGPGLWRLGLHAATLAALGTVAWLSVGTSWYWPAALAYGVVLVFLFAPLHETIHRTAFRSPWLNEVVAASCGLVLLLPPRYFRAFHLAHHRHTQDPAHDPDLGPVDREPALRYGYDQATFGTPFDIVVSNAGAGEAAGDA